MMILDTNIVSEFMTSPPSGAVLRWLNDQHVPSLYLTSIATRNIKDFQHCQLELINPFEY